MCCDFGDINVSKSENQLPYSLDHISNNFYDIIYVDHGGWHHKNDFCFVK